MQKDDVAMGSPLGPAVANVFLCHFEEQWMSDCPVNYKPISYKRYVENIFLLFPSELHLSKFLNHMNSKHRNIKITVVREENNPLSFLDIKMFRDGGKFQTSVYRKFTFCGVLTSFESFLPISYNYNLVSTLIHRGFVIFSSYRTLHFEILKSKQIFRINRCLKNLVHRCVKMYSHKVFIKHPNICIVSKQKSVCLFPFLSRKSLEIKKSLQNVTERSLPYCTLKVIFRSPSKIVNHFHFKDVLPKKLCSCNVYSFSVIAVTRFITVKQNPIFTSEQLNIWEFHI